jgi:hypothetical protein
MTVDVAVMTCTAPCQHGHPLTTDAKQQLIEPETAPGVVFRDMKSYRVFPRRAAARGRLCAGAACPVSCGLSPCCRRLRERPAHLAAKECAGIRDLADLRTSRYTMAARDVDHGNAGRSNLPRNRDRSRLRR